MRKKIKVMPAKEGLLVRKPAMEGGAMLSKKGEMVLDRTYWHRRIKSGDVVLVDDKSGKAKLAKKKES